VKALCDQRTGKRLNVRCEFRERNAAPVIDNKWLVAKVRGSVIQ
jgi:hypothetical protein